MFSRKSGVQGVLTLCTRLLVAETVTIDPSVVDEDGILQERVVTREQLAFEPRTYTLYLTVCKKRLLAHTLKEDKQVLANI